MTTPNENECGMDKITEFDVAKELHSDSLIVAYLRDFVGEENPVLLRAAIENTARALERRRTEDLWHSWQSGLSARGVSQEEAGTTRAFFDGWLAENPGASLKDAWYAAPDELGVAAQPGAPAP